MISAPDPDYTRYRAAAAISLGEMLRAARVHHGLSQEQVALEAGIAVYTYGNLERGRSRSGIENPTLDTLLRVFLALSIEPPALSPRPGPAARPIVAG